MVSVLACPVSAPTLAGLFLFAIVFEKLVHGDAEIVSNFFERSDSRISVTIGPLSNGTIPNAAILFQCANRGVFFPAKPLHIVINQNFHLQSTRAIIEHY